MRRVPRSPQSFSPIHVLERIVRFNESWITRVSVCWEGATDLFFAAPGDVDGGADVDPFVKESRGIGAGKRDADATVGGGVIGHAGESMEKDVAGDLHAPGHGGIVVFTGVVHPVFVRAGGEMASGGVAIATRADVGVQDDESPLIGVKALAGEVDFDAFGTCDGGEAATSRGDVEFGFFGICRNGGTSGGKGVELDPDDPIDEASLFGWEGGSVDFEGAAITRQARVPLEAGGHLREGDVDLAGFDGERDGLDVCSQRGG